MPSAVIVGAGPGIGAAAARRFLAEGLDVALISRHPQPLAAALQGTSQGVLAFPADAGDPDALASALHTATDRLGPPSCLLYNAVAWPPGTLLDVTPEDLLASLAVNAVGAVVAAQVCAPHMAPGSSVLITGGGIVFAPSAEAAALALGKTASRLTSHLLAESLTPKGVHVATVLVAGQVAPGGRMDPDLIAGELWRLHTQPREAWQHETTWR